MCEDWFHPSCLNPKLDVQKADEEIGDWYLMCVNCSKQNKWIYAYLKEQTEIQLGEKRSSKEIEGVTW